jgi:hypothetical protein
VLALDGARAHLRIDDDRLPLADGPFTLECWLRAEEFRARMGVLCKTEGSEYGIFASEGVPEFLVHLGGRYATAKAARPVLQAGRWHHVAGVFDGAEVRLYVDGERIAAAPGRGARTRNALPLIGGADVDGRGEPSSAFRGELDEVRLAEGARYEGARFEPERRLEPDGETLLLLHMDAAAGTWAYDSSPGHRHPPLRDGARIAAAATNGG